MITSTRQPAQQQAQSPKAEKTSSGKDNKSPGTDSSASPCLDVSQRFYVTDVKERNFQTFWYHFLK